MYHVKQIQLRETAKKTKFCGVINYCTRSTIN